MMRTALYPVILGVSIGGALAGCSPSSTSAPNNGVPGGDGGTQTDASDDAGTQTDASGGDGGTQTDASGDGGSSEDASSPSGGGRVFVTSVAFGANLDTASGGPGTAADGAPFGDTICTAGATSANLGGTWKAWLSSSSGSALERVGGSGPWTLVDKTTVVFGSHADLASAPMHAIDHDEFGNPAPPGCVWTGTDNGGGASASFCKSWTSISMSDTATYGDPVGTSDWTNVSTAPCNSVCRLYCFEQ
jgi:hypothetical protein